MKNLLFKTIILAIIALFLSIGTSSSIYADEQVNHCHDKESWKEWDNLVQKYPHDMDIQMLHAVRIGFCKKIEAGSITFEMAKDAFNHLHETVFKKAKQEKGQWLKSKEL